MPCDLVQSILFISDLSIRLIFDIWTVHPSYRLYLNLYPNQFSHATKMTLPSNTSFLPIPYTYNKHHKYLIFPNYPSIAWSESQPHANRCLMTSFTASFSNIQHFDQVNKLIPSIFKLSTRAIESSYKPTKFTKSSD